MKYKTLFRLGVKLVGVIMVAEATATFVSTVVSPIVVVFSMSNTSGLTSADWWRPLAWPLIGVAAKGGIGVYLYFGGRWIVNLAIPSNRPYCPECAYDLTGAAVERCPECGTPFRWEDVRPKVEDRSLKIEEAD